MLDGLKWLIAENRRALSEDLITVYASQASFYIIISAIPFSMLLLSVIQFLLPVDAAWIVTAVRPFLPQKLHHISEIVILELFQRSGGVVSLSALTALWTSSRGVAAVSRGVRRVYNIPDPTFLRTIVKDGLNTLLLILILFLSLAVLVFGSSAAEFLANRFNISDAVLTFFSGMRVIVFLAMLTALFAILYRMISGGEIPFAKHIGGAIFSAVGWVIFSLAYEFYIENFSNYSYIYGSLTAVVLLMLWLYFCMIIFLYGAEINKRLQKK